MVSFLKDKKDLGVHTEVITDAITGLVDAGVINGSQKSLDRGKIVTTFAMGTQKLYDYVDNNPLFSFNPTEYGSGGPPPERGRTSVQRSSPKCVSDTTARRMARVRV